MKENFQLNPESSEAEKKYGSNVELVYKVIRHGERTPAGELTDFGRKVTKEKAAASGLKKEGFDAVKAQGSQAGPKSQGMGRSLETADIYGQGVRADGSPEFKSRPNPRLNFETLKTAAPYNHTKIYNSYLPENFGDLADEEKASAAAKAQSATVNYLFSLNTPEAITYKKEIAGAFAAEMLHRQGMTDKLKNGSKVLMPAGTHGPMPELFLQQALVRKSENGEEIKGFNNIDEIGGPMNPSESFDFIIQRDANGELQKTKVQFDDSSRPKEGEMWLDQEKLMELSDFYKELHKEDMEQ